MKTDRLVVGIVGCGYMGVRHARTYGALRPDVHLLLVDTDRRLAARTAGRLAQTGLAVEPSTWESLIGREELTAVDVCTPPGAHAAFVQQALAAGLPALCEKPLTPDPDAEGAILAAGERSAGWLAVNYPYRQHPALQWATQVLAEGRIGRPLAAYLRLGVRGGGATWRHRRGGEGGGVANEVLCHLIDLAISVFGPATDGRLLETGVVWPLRPIRGRLERVTAADYAVLALQHESGVHSLLTADMASPGYCQSVEVQGTAGGLWTSVIPSLPALLRQTVRAGSYHEERVDHPAVDLLQRTLEAFIRVLPAGPPPAELLPRPGVARWLRVADGGMGLA